MWQGEEKKNAKTLSSLMCVWGIWWSGGAHYVHMESTLEKPGENENELCFSSSTSSLFLSSFYLVLLLLLLFSSSSPFFFVFPFTYRELFRRFAFAQVRVNNCPYMVDAGEDRPPFPSPGLSAKQPPVAHLICMCSYST